ncbi:MAG: RecQ family ATP-dependent DNA helicase [Melioribacteraceae bacterium]|nr:RecQ family ATP-dependent DNA helicase [Melioribacteraceae bacterium]
MPKKNPEQILKQFFGFDQFRENQLEIIETILKGKNLLSVLPTGAGKTLCYQIPALLSEKFSIIISPLISLMKDQVDAINQIEKVSAFINSTLDYSASEKVLNNIEKKKIKLLYIAPERLENEIFLQRIKQLDPDYLFIDEAHCISQWGHNFRPSYRNIKKIIELIKFKNIAAFTATATKEVRKDIVTQLGLEKPKIIVGGFERENLHLNVIHTRDKKAELLSILRDKNHLPAIIYSATRKSCEAISELLNEKKIQNRVYHAGISNEIREIIQDEFSSGQSDLIVATNAFGMGIDKSDIRSIIHYHFPGSLESYYQEIGRAGRDGKDAEIFLLFDPKDHGVQEYFINSTHPTPNEIQIVYNTLFDYNQIALGSKSDQTLMIDPGIKILFESKSINESKLNSILLKLQELGVLKFTNNTGRFYHCKIRIPSNDLHNYLKQTRSKKIRSIITELLKIYGAGIFVKSIRLDPQSLSSRCDLSFSELINELNSLNSKGILEFKIIDSSGFIQMLQERRRFSDLKLDETELILNLENARRKLRMMLDYCYTKSCRFKFLLDYFEGNSTTYTCRKCDNCKGENKSKILERNEYLENKIISLIGEADFAVREHLIHKILRGEAKNFTRQNLSSFGSCEHYSRDEIQNSLDYLLSRNLIKKINSTYGLHEKGIDLILDDSKIDLKNIDEIDRTLEIFNQLREVRKEAAKKFGQPVQFICSDELLRKVAELEPTTQSELMSINGFTQKMFNKFGEDIIFIISEYKRKYPEEIMTKALPENLSFLRTMLDKKYSMQDISRITKLPSAVISLQIESLLEYDNKLDIHSIINPKIIDKIRDVVEKNRSANLKELKALLPNDVSYAEIRIVKKKIEVLDPKQF